ncbi:MAG TPA: efflux RND transporter periplasmic adaptor subunit [Nannocystaceae bacterium]|nr:efflux RND transporter periplasmic adaptor subunit [Nannocystaceae bacterium]
MLSLLAIAACCEAPDAPAPPSAPVHPDEAELGVVHLDAESIAHLGITTATVTTVDGHRTRTVGGVITVPPGRALSVTAPVAGTLRAGEHALAAGVAVERDAMLLRLVPIAPVDRDTRAQTRRQRDASKARLEVARARVERTRTLLAQRGTSQRALEEAEAELATAEAEDEAAAARERMLRRAPLAADAVLPLFAPHDGVVRSIGAEIGQSVAAGAFLFDIVATRELWIRVAVNPAELDRIAPTAAARVHRLGSEVGAAERAAPVVAPPSADPLAASVDLFFALPASARDFRPGERVAVELDYRQEEQLAAVPAGAIVFDFDGGAWVYACDSDDAFRRRRVEVAQQHDGQAWLRRGPAPGTCVVAVGALELFGTELGVAH